MRGEDRTEDGKAAASPQGAAGVAALPPRARQPSHAGNLGGLRQNGVEPPSRMRVTLIAAQSVDGFITRHDEPGTAFTSAADKAYFARVLAEFDCAVMGSRTYGSIRGMIRARLQPGAPRRVVLTRQVERHQEDAVDDLLEFTRETPPDLLARLEQQGHRECALLGGGQIHQLFFQHDCVDQLWLTFEPQLFGCGTPLVAGTVDVSLTLTSAERLAGSDSLLVKYAVRRSAPPRS